MQKPRSDGDTPDPLQQVYCSGFAFQKAVEHAVRATAPDHGWTVAATELPWETPDRHPRKGFLDLLFAREAVRLAVECKQVMNASWVFLVPKGASPTNRCRTTWWNGRAPDPHLLSQIETKAFCDECTFEPSSLESDSCAMPKKGTRDTLESVVAELVTATLAIAGNPQIARPTDIELYIPVVVTTAKLVSCVFDPGAVSLADGQLRDARFTEEKLIRFRKTLTVDRSNQYDEGDESLEAWQGDRIRTVLIVNASTITDFLQSLQGIQPDDSILRRYRNRASLARPDPTCVFLEDRMLESPRESP